MRGDRVEERVEIALAASRRDAPAQDDLRTVVVARGIERDRAGRALLAHDPTGQATRGLHHVVLRVAAMHAERVQLEELARVVLVRYVAARAHRVLATVEV